VLDSVLRALLCFKTAFVFVSWFEVHLASAMHLQPAKKKRWPVTSVPVATKPELCEICAAYRPRLSHSMYLPALKNVFMWLRHLQETQNDAQQSQLRDLVLASAIVHTGVANKTQKSRGLFGPEVASRPRGR